MSKVAEALARAERVTAADLSTEVLLDGPETGMPRLLLHGGGLDRAARAWSDTWDELSAEAPVIAPDLPGYGGTQGFHRPHRVADLGTWALAVLDALGIERVDAIGNSMGGATALWLALEHPERVRRVVPVGSYGIARKALAHGALRLHSEMQLSGRVAAIARSPLGARMAAAAIFAWPARIPDQAVLDLQEEAQLQVEERAFADFLRGEVGLEGFRTCFLDRLPQMEPPALFIHGRSDRLVPVRHAREAAELARDGRLLEMDAGHWPMRERPAEFSRAVRQFLEED